jgi:hypothetical protein
MVERPQEAGPAGRGHEERDVQIRPLAIAGMSLALLVGLSLLTMWWLFDYFAARQARLAVVPSPVFEGRQLPPEPRLQVSPQHELQQMRAAEMAALHSYGWVDRPAGIVSIPIGRAIELLAEHGLPSRKAEDQALPTENRGR